MSAAVSIVTVDTTDVTAQQTDRAVRRAAFELATDRAQLHLTQADYAAGKSNEWALLAHEEREQAEAWMRVAEEGSRLLARDLEVPPLPCSCPSCATEDRA